MQQARLPDKPSPQPQFFLLSLPPSPSFSSLTHLVRTGLKPPMLAEAGLRCLIPPVPTLKVLGFQAYTSIFGSPYYSSEASLPWAVF